MSLKIGILLFFVGAILVGIIRKRGFSLTKPTITQWGGLSWHDPTLDHADPIDPNHLARRNQEELEASQRISDDLDDYLRT